MIKSILVVLSLVVFALAGELRLQLLSGPRGHFPIDSVTVYVDDIDNNAVPDLTSKNFSLSLAKEKVDLLNSIHLIKTRNTKILFCVDISGTMAGAPLANVKNAVNSWLKKLPANVEAGLCTIGDEFIVQQRFTANRRQITSILDTLKANDQKTELFYGLYKTLEYFEKYENSGMRFIILFSDGKNEGSEAYNIDDCVNKAITNNVVIHAIGFHRIDSVYLKNLEKLSDLSGGVFVHPRSTTDIRIETAS